jgi:hypothetical protein
MSTLFFANAAPAGLWNGEHLVGGQPDCGKRGKAKRRAASKRAARARRRNRA